SLKPVVPKASRAFRQQLSRRRSASQGSSVRSEQPNTGSLLSHYVALHSAQCSKKLALFCRADLVFVERFLEILDQRVKVSIGDAHSLVRFFHVFPFVLAGAARHHGNLVDETCLELRQAGGILRGIGEKFVNSGIGGTVSYEVINDGGYSLLCSKPGV